MKEKNSQNKLEQARLLITKNNLDEAHVLLKEAIGENPKNEKAFNLMGALYERSENIEGACFMYRVALKINPDYVPAQINLHRLAQITSVLTGFARENQS